MSEARGWSHAGSPQGIPQNRTGKGLFPETQKLSLLRSSELSKSADTEGRSDKPSSPPPRPSRPQDNTAFRDVLSEGGSYSIDEMSEVNTPVLIFLGNSHGFPEA